jgi:hypothetical protein
MTQVATNDCINKAWRNWRSVTGGNYAKFLDFVEQWEPPMVWDKTGNFHAHPNVVRRIEMLCGPHHRAIIKAYYAKQQIT